MSTVSWNDIVCSVTQGSLTCALRGAKMESCATGSKNDPTTMLRDTRTGHCYASGCENGMLPCHRAQKWDATGPWGMKTGCRHAPGCKNGVPPHRGVQKWDTTVLQGTKTGCCRTPRVWRWSSGMQKMPLCLRCKNRALLCCRVRKRGTATLWGAKMLPLPFPQLCRERLVTSGITWGIYYLSWLYVLQKLLHNLSVFFVGAFWEM